MAHRRLFAVGNYTARESFAGLGAVDSPWADYAGWPEGVRSCVTANETLIGIRGARAVCGVPYAPPPEKPGVPKAGAAPGGGGLPDWLLPVLGISGLFVVSGLVLWAKRKKR